MEDYTTAEMEEALEGSRIGQVSGQTVSQPYIPALVPSRGVPLAAVRVLGGSVSTLAPTQFGVLRP